MCKKLFYGYSRIKKNSYFLRYYRTTALVYQHSIHSSSFQTSRKELLHDFCKLMKNEMDTLVWVWCHNTDLKWQTNFMSWSMFFYNSYAIHCKCNHTTTNCPDIKILTLVRNVGAYRILSFKRPGRLYIFFDFGVGVYWRGALNREGCLFKKLDFLSNSLLSLGAIQ